MNYFRYLETASLENKLQILRAKWGKLSLDYNNFLFTSSFEKSWKLLESYDPTKNKQYLQWVITKGISGWKHKSYRLFQEDIQTVRSMLEQFNKLKQTNKLKPEHKDINRIKDDEELFDIVSLYSPHKGRTKEQDEIFFKARDAEIFYESSGIEIIIPHTKEASCYFGSNTKWCTARTDSLNAFKDYNDTGYLYIVTNKKDNKKYQFYFDVNDHEHQFMDAKDNPVDWLELYKDKSFINELKKGFRNQAKDCNFIPLMQDYTLNTLKKFFKTTLYSMSIEEVALLLYKPLTDDIALFLINQASRLLGADVYPEHYNVPVLFLQNLFKTKDLKSIDNKYKNMIHKHWPDASHLVDDPKIVRKK